MKVIIDTCSLISLARYYMPFDSQETLFKYIKTEFEDQSLIIIDAVYRECEYSSQKLVLKSLKYLSEKDFQNNFKIPVKTEDLLPPSPSKFYNLLDNNFRTKSSRILTDAEFETLKKSYLESADAKIILYALIRKSKKEEIIVVTEETEFGNDNKAFKKIPAICKILEIEVMSLPELLLKYDGINFEFN
ncbi:MAG: DUF4411 family protein [Candidatus Saccharimonadaceae bacterium]